MAIIDRFIETNSEGYRTRPEVISAAVRQFVEDRQGKAALQGRRVDELLECPGCHELVLIRGGLADAPGKLMSINHAKGCEWRGRESELLQHAGLAPAQLDSTKESPARARPGRHT